MTRLCLEVFLLSVLLNVIHNCRAGSAGAVVVSAVKDEDAALSCLSSNVTDPKSCYRIRWVRSATGTRPEKLIFQWPHKPQKPERVRLVDDRTGRACLFLELVQKSDEGLYRYEIWEGWDIIQAQNISLKVKDCKTLDSEKATLGLPFKLKCKVNATLAPSNISWVKLKGEKHEPVNSTRVQADGLFLTIQSVADSDQGWYRCNYTVGQSHRCFRINLQVQGVFVVTTVSVPTAPTSQTASEVVQISRETKFSETLVPVVASVVSGIFILAALTVLVVFYKRYTQRCGGQLQGSPAGSFKGSSEFYENATLPRLFDTTNRTNSLYSFQEESTFSFISSPRMDEDSPAPSQLIN